MTAKEVLCKLASVSGSVYLTMQKLKNCRPQIDVTGQEYV